MTPQISPRLSKNDLTFSYITAARQTALRRPTRRYCRPRVWGYWYEGTISYTQNPLSYSEYSKLLVQVSTPKLGRWPTTPFIAILGYGRKEIRWRLKTRPKNAPKYLNSLLTSWPEGKGAKVAQYPVTYTKVPVLLYFGPNSGDPSNVPPAECNSQANLNRDSECDTPTFLSLSMQFFDRYLSISLEGDTIAVAENSQTEK
ncbi:hypothetical protein C8F04DRAFT_1184642 [Mycena alexandri]|uniref:Uncharacterized protein n=1 Tax=Mycena alexandri TaxID=1745969 RepID=A0AAD6X1C1_9AGAR|nr:hypothetical protein C8F04DRAFT_1184642 [Mycena alexandri]